VAECSERICAKVGSLESRGTGLGNAERFLEMLVESVDESIGKALPYVSQGTDSAWPWTKLTQRKNKTVTRHKGTSDWRRVNSAARVRVLSLVFSAFFLKNPAILVEKEVDKAVLEWKKLMSEHTGDEVVLYATCRL
jgi:hypothetical protein